MGAIRNLSLHERWRDAFEDAISLHWLREFRRHRNLVTFAVANNFRDVPAHLFNDYQNFLRNLLIQGHTIVYDADALSAGWIEAIAPPNQRLGISAALYPRSCDGPVLYVNNSFIRLRLFSLSDTVIVTPRSTVGAALLIDGGAHLVFDPTKRWKPLKKPKKEAEEEKKERVLGLRLPEKPITEITDFLKRDKPIALDGKVATFDPMALVSMLDNTEIVELIQHADLQLALENRIDGLGPLPPQDFRTVFIGWSANHEEFRQLVYDSVSAVASLGIPVTTGGSGGYMGVANEAAWRAGAISIGIPFLGLSRLSREQEVPTQWHTQTLGTRSYDVRIHCLLYRQNLILVGPGSTGTLQELAAALLEVQANSSRNHKFIFLSRSFYGPMVDWLTKQVLPTEVSSRISIIGDAKEITSLITRENGG